MIYKKKRDIIPIDSIDTPRKFLVFKESFKL